MLRTFTGGNLVNHRAGIVFLLVALSISLLFVACDGADTDAGVDPTPAVNGPALVMFYTDN